MNFAARIMGPVTEAWQEFRVSKLRVMLSLIVVTISVAAFTAVVALGQMLSQGFQEQMERQSGRAALLTFSSNDPYSGTSVDSEIFADAFAATAERYGVEWTSPSTWLNLKIPGVGYINGQAVGVDYAVMHRITVEQGSWFTESDAERFIPVVIINRYWWEQLGSPPISTHPLVEIEGVIENPTVGLLPGQRTSALVVGVAPDRSSYEDYSAFLLYDDAEELFGDSMMQNSGSYEAWVPPENAEELRAAMETSIAAHLPEGTQVNAYRSDQFAYSDQNQLDVVLLIFGGIALLVLFLGALSLLNITLVTIRHRIREIGVRRSFGATAGRVFFSVMLESVVATVVAGGIGIMLVIFALRLPVVTDFIAQGMQDVPAFPVSAAVIGLLVSAGVGALAGLIPALVAVRVKPIDAIRY